MPIYIKYGDIKGDVTAEGHKDWIEVNSFQWGVGRGISSPTGGGADRESSAPSVSEIVVTKAQCTATTKLLDEALQGEGVKVQIDFVKTDGKKLETYMFYKLENVMISGYSISSGGERPMESLSLNFTKIEYKGTQMDLANKGATSSSVIYDLAKATVG
jgi:type VI secretion system secreted protein Hcp